MGHYNFIMDVLNSNSIINYQWCVSLYFQDYFIIYFYDYISYFDFSINLEFKYLIKIVQRYFQYLFNFCTNIKL